MDRRVKPMGWCERDRKLLYTSKKNAKKAAREHSPGGHGTAYPCPEIEHLWHWGHLGPAVSRGSMSRSQRYDR